MRHIRFFLIMPLFGLVQNYNLFLCYYERHFMLSLSQENQANTIEAFNSTSRYFKDLLNIDNDFFLING